MIIGKYIVTTLEHVKWTLIFLFSLILVNMKHCWTVAGLGYRKQGWEWGVEHQQ